MKLTKQTALKMALLLVLAINVSWEHLSFNSGEFASNSEVVTPNAGPPAPVAPAPATTSTPPAHLGVRPTPAPAAAAPARPMTTGDLKICNENFRVTYREIERNGRIETEILARRETATCDTCYISSITREGTLANVMSSKADADRAITSVVEILLRQNGSTCPGTVARTAPSPSPSPRRVGRDRDTDRDRDRDRDRDARNVCRDVPQDEQLDCLIGKLEKADDNPGRGDERAQSRVIMSRINSLVNGPLRTQLRSRLLSRDEGRQEEGDEAVDRTIEAIRELGDAHDLDRRQITRLVNQMEGLRVGGRTVRTTRTYSEDARNLRDEMGSAWHEWRRDPTNMWAASQVESLRQRHSMLNDTINRELMMGPFQQMQAFNRQGFLTGQDYREFAQPVDELRAMMMQALNPNQIRYSSVLDLTARDSLSPSLNPGMSLSTDLLRMRLGTGAGTGLRSHGIVLPATPPRLSFPGETTLRPTFTSGFPSARPTMGGRVNRGF